MPTDYKMRMWRKKLKIGEKIKFLQVTLVELYLYFDKKMSTWPFQVQKKC